MYYRTRSQYPLIDPDELAGLQNQTTPTPRRHDR
jgi:hypothetical protein